jgi:hypothetical protein
MTSAIFSDRHTVIERTFAAPLEELWELWTTRDGFESWWGPLGFAAKVHWLDLRPGGQLRYRMTAVGARQIRFLRHAGLPLSTEACLTFTRIALRKSIAYRHRADFIPGVEPYDISNSVEFHQEDRGVRVVVRQAPMHSYEWTVQAWNGMKSQLGRIPAALARYQLV